MANNRYDAQRAAWRKQRELNKAIRAKYGSLREWKKKEFFSMKTLKKRGWNTELVAKHLGNRDETTSGMYRACDLWLKQRVLAAENKAEVKASMKTTNDRAEKLAGAAMETFKRIQAEVAKWPTVLISKAEAIRRMKPSFKKGLGKSSLDDFAVMGVRKQAYADQEQRVLAQPKHQRIYRDVLAIRVNVMMNKKRII